ncbi:DUF4417 domain-containing protein [Olsenella sp. HMSC062G07]|uniref:DUF4417 domain-containing protein n=1 Tax=Olsenella sp. HMSC062G07 TaxID=1739330 RepID=UPI0008A41E10|nr:DUF4417 domain-containing protein [Olsenella sp. HMSC062G07]OFK24216.1 hypothetical protein HMPREF2826_08095 [Olsenella sp. HMSC062G07]
MVTRDLQGFNYAKTTRAADKADLGCHFFIDDYQFERVWQRPGAYIDALRPYQCVLTPDFSLYMDMPDAMQEWNRYRSAALGRYWEQNGITVVPTLSWAQPSSYKFCFKGIPRQSTVATSTVGVARGRGARDVWRDGMREAMRRLEPSLVLLYGKNIGFDFGGCEVVEYKAGGGSIGGRGSYSATAGAMKERVKLLGADTNAHLSNIGGAPDSRRDVIEIARNAGFSGVYGTDEIKTQSMSSYMQQVHSLEQKYGALHAVPTQLLGADGKGFYAAASSAGNGQAVLVLHRRNASNVVALAHAHEREENSGFKMPTDGRLTSRANYTITHEYGHLVQNALYTQAVRNGYTGSERKFAGTAKREIEEIAIGRYGGSGSMMSGYGHYNAHEFFAESFAYSQLGAPNAYGRAMNDYLGTHRIS